MAKILPVTTDDIPDITALAKECWHDFFDEMPDALTDAACGMIVRNNYIDPEFSFKVVEDGRIVAVAFAGTAESQSHPEEFYESKLDELDETDREWLKTQRAYHIKADKECKKLLDDRTFKLALFMSASKGYGKPILEYALDRMRSRGFDRMALWTDTSCNNAYYPAHGFTLQSTLNIPEYSTAEEDYELQTYTKEI